MLLSCSRVISLCLAILIAGISSGCVELPGFYYNVMLKEEPTGSDCANLVDALRTKLNLRVREPSPYQCQVTLVNDGAKPSRNVFINAFVRERRIVVEVNTWIAPSADGDQFVDRVMAIVREQFPSAELVRFRPTHGLAP